MRENVIWIFRIAGLIIGILFVGRCYVELFSMTYWEGVLWAIVTNLILFLVKFIERIIKVVFA